MKKMYVKRLKVFIMGLAVIALTTLTTVPVNPGVLIGDPPPGPITKPPIPPGV